MGGAGVSGSSRSCIKDIITPGEAGYLAGMNGRVPLDLEPVSVVIDRMVSSFPGVHITPKSYARVEQKSDGHHWHVDTGDMGHMTWCRASASVGLSRPDEYRGGEFEFDNPYRQIASHFCDAILYTSGEVHRVLPHTGNRRVLLVFLGEKDGE